jgi:hypothetical protein
MLAAESGAAEGSTFTTSAGGQTKNFQVGKDLIEEETAETNRVKFAVYLYYAKNVGTSMAIASIIFYFLFQARNS